MDYATAFAEIVVNENLRHLDFADIPNSVRVVIIENLSKFSQLKSLTLRNYAQAAGQWLYKDTLQSMLKGICGLTSLCLFSLKNGCTNEILTSICLNCRWTLEIIDIESSKQVSDACIPYLLMCIKVTELNLFRTGLTDEGKGILISKLPKLSHLPRGDFLCDALAWIEEEDDGPECIFSIREFFPSQKYYFHEDWQMEMVASCCPYISKMFFIYHEQCVPDYLVLLPFANITDLDLYGGHYYDDKICDLLQIRGEGISKLRLISVKGIDYK